MTIRWMVIPGVQQVRQRSVAALDAAIGVSCAFGQSCPDVLRRVYGQISGQGRQPVQVGSRLTANIVSSMLASCPSTLIGARDQVLLALGFAGMGRAHLPGRGRVVAAKRREPTIGVSSNLKRDYCSFRISGVQALTRTAHLVFWDVSASDPK